MSISTITPIDIDPVDSLRFKRNQCKPDGIHLSKEQLERLVDAIDKLDISYNDHLAELEEHILELQEAYDAFQIKVDELTEQFGGTAVELSSDDTTTITLIDMPIDMHVDMHVDMRDCYHPTFAITPVK